MIKLANSHGRTLLAAFKILQLTTESSALANGLINAAPETLGQAMAIHQRNIPEFWTIVDQTHGRPGDDSVGEVLGMILDQLRSTGSDYDSYPGLLDSIVEVLMHPYCRNLLSGGYLEELRHAILRPEEHRQVQQNRVLSCGSCGHRFVVNELGTLAGSGDQLHFVCSLCATPTYKACSADPRCDVRVNLNKSTLTDIQFRANCAHHQKKTTKAEESMPAPSGLDQAIRDHIRNLRDQPAQPAPGRRVRTPQITQVVPPPTHSWQTPNFDEEE